MEKGVSYAHIHTYTRAHHYTHHSFRSAVVSIIVTLLYGIEITFARIVIFKSMRSSTAFGSKAVPFLPTGLLPVLWTLRLTPSTVIWRSGSTDSGPQGHTNPLGLITGGHFIFISQITNVVCGEFGAWVGTLSHWVPDAAPLLTIPHRQYEFHR